MFRNLLENAFGRILVGELEFFRNEDPDLSVLSDRGDGNGVFELDVQLALEPDVAVGLLDARDQDPLGGFLHLHLAGKVIVFHERVRFWLPDSNSYHSLGFLLHPIGIEDAGDLVIKRGVIQEFHVLYHH